MDDATRIRLQEILTRSVERAMTIANAAGAAVALQWEGEMRCRASSGPLAPPFGSTVSSDSGISGECVRLGKRLCAHDTEQDSRVNREVCRELGVRSVMVAPVRCDQRIVGIVEVFSRKAGAFGVQPQDQLELLADAVGRALEEVDLPLSEIAVPIAPPPPLPAPLPLDIDEADSPRPDMAVALPPAPLPSFATASQPETHDLSYLSRIPDDPIPDSACLAELEERGELVPPPLMFSHAAHNESWLQRDLRRIGVFLALGVGLVALLFVSIGNLYRTELRSFLSPVKAAAPREPLPDAVPQKVAASANPVGPQDQNLSSAPPVTPMRIAKPMPGKPMLRGRISPAAARVVEFKAPASPRPPLLTPPKPATNAATNSAPKVVDQIPASSTPPTASAEPAQRPQDSSAAITGGRLLHRVDPVYPDEARLNRLQGTVALHAFIAEDGSVQEVSVVSGDPDLARAAVQAVSQWRYEPYSIAGKVTRVAVDITVDFKLP